MSSKVGFKISVLIILLNDEFPRRGVFVKFSKVNLDVGGSILFRLLMRVHLSL